MKSTTRSGLLWCCAIIMSSTLTYAAARAALVACNTGCQTVSAYGYEEAAGPMKGQVWCRITQNMTCFNCCRGGASTAVCSQPNANQVCSDTCTTTMTFTDYGCSWVCNANTPNTQTQEVKPLTGEWTGQTKLCPCRATTSQ